MQKLLLVALTMLASATTLSACAAPIAPEPAKLSAAVERMVTQPTPEFLTQRQTLRDALSRYYTSNQFQPGWFDGARPRDAASELLNALSSADDHGLNPGDYRIDRLRNSLSQLADQSAPSAAAIAEADLQLSLAFIHYAQDLHAGRIAPTEIDPLWVAEDSPVDYSAALQQALDASAVGETLQQLAPQHEGYQQLRAALAKMRDQFDADTQWPRIPEGEVLEVGDRAPRVVTLRQRLAAENLLDATDARGETANIYDQQLSDAITVFQRRHGLAVDGLLGPGTVAALNVSPQQRLRQITLNMERWRWLPDELGTRYVVANVAGYSVSAVQDGETVLEMRAVVGEEYNDHATPLFTDVMETLVFRPYWNIPHSIAMDEILPKARQNPGYLAQKNYEIVTDYSPGATVHPVNAANLSRVAAEDLRLRERPGPTNSLGRVKFLFPNSYAIYMHDSPANHLFNKDQRAFSHGCIRLERPADMASFVLAGKTGWDAARIDSAMNRGERQEIELSTPLPVYILYWTSVADDNGNVSFHPDLYGHDAKLDQALKNQRKDSISG